MYLNKEERKRQQELAKLIDYDELEKKVWTNESEESIIDYLVKRGLNKEEAMLFLQIVVGDQPTLGKILYWAIYLFIGVVILLGGYLLNLLDNDYIFISGLFLLGFGSYKVIATLYNNVRMRVKMRVEYKNKN